MVDGTTDVDEVDDVGRGAMGVVDGTDGGTALGAAGPSIVCAYVQSS